MSVSPPRVFISYSHDSAEHKKWVLDFATTLRSRMIDAILDQWDLGPGDDIPQFVEQNVANADYVIMVCTPRYVQKANAGEGGVGYEKMIMTQSSMEKISDSNVIPIIREKSDPLTPTFISTKYRLDFSNDDEIEAALDELGRKLLNAPLYKKPELGKDPFRPLDQARPDRTADGIRDAMTIVAQAYDKTRREHPYHAELINIIKTSAMNRLAFDKYFAQAIVEGLLEHEHNVVKVTPKGMAYLEAHGIIDA